MLTVSADFHITSIIWIPSCLRVTVFKALKPTMVVSSHKTSQNTNETPRDHRKGVGKIEVYNCVSTYQHQSNSPVEPRNRLSYLNRSQAAVPPARDRPCLERAVGQPHAWPHNSNEHQDLAGFLLLALSGEHVPSSSSPPLASPDRVLSPTRTSPWWLDLPRFQWPSCLRLGRNLRAREKRKRYERHF